MKKYLYLFFVALFATMSVTLTSCGDDDEDEANDNPLVGTWVGTMYEEGGYHSSDTEVVTMTFTADGVMTAQSVDPQHPQYDWSFTGTYAVQFVQNGGDGFYAISLRGNFAGEEEIYEDDLDWEPIEFINDNTLIISFDGSDYKLIRQ